MLPFNNEYINSPHDLLRNCVPCKRFFDNTHFVITKRVVVNHVNLSSLNWNMVSLMFHEPLTDASMIAFERYKCGKQLVGSQLDSLLYGFYHMYPCYQQFVNYLKLSRKTYYMTKDEWLSLYHEQEAVLNKGYVTPTRRLSWPCLLDEFVEYNESVWKMECEE